MPALPGGPRPWQARRTGLRIARSQVVESPTWIVIPVRSLTDGKRRLAPVLGPDERADLVRRLFLRTLEAALAAGPPVLVVSPDPAALALARDRGATGLEEPRPVELNHALELAARAAAARGAGALLVVSADLPDLEAADLRAMLPPQTDPVAPASAAPARAGGAAQADKLVRIAPDEAGIGTNALYVRPPGLLSFEYGETSCPRHLEQARARGARIDRVERPGLRFDLDTPDDLERYERRRGRPDGEREDR